MSKEIILKNGKIAIVDDEDFKEISKIKWSENKKNQYNYATHCFGKFSICMHRKIFEIHGIDISKKFVDHINHDPLDNRKVNLRICSHAENMRNRKISKLSKTGFKGVFKKKTKNSFSTELKYFGKRIFRKTCPTKEDAARIYDLMAIAIYGKFANTNFPKSNYDGIYKPFLN